MAVARDGALYLHNMIKGNIHHPVFQKHLVKMGSNFLKLHTIQDTYNSVQHVALSLNTTRCEFCGRSYSKRSNLFNHLYRGMGCPNGPNRAMVQRGYVIPRLGANYF